MSGHRPDGLHKPDVSDLVAPGTGDLGGIWIENPQLQPAGFSHHYFVKDVEYRPVSRNPDGLSPTRAWRYDLIEDTMQVHFPILTSRRPITEQESKTSSSSHDHSIAELYLYHDRSTTQSGHSSESVWEVLVIQVRGRGAINQSTDKGPAPAMRRKIKPISMEKSVRASASVGQKPLFKKIGILVV